jgi:flagellar biosynthesis/type III secretory pathway M-ring protein FliF/YscJ
VNMPFQVAPEEALPPAKSRYLEMAAPAARYALPLLAVAFLSLFVLRPLAKSLATPASGSAALRGSLIASAGEIERSIASKELPVREQVTDWARKNPQDTANIIKGWTR